MIPDSFTRTGEFRTKVCDKEQTIEVYRHGPTGIDFVLVPGGTGVVGSRHGHRFCVPRHRVRVRPFLLASTPVTLEVWREVMGAEVAYQPWSPDRAPVAGLPGDHPVADVSALDCDEFCSRTGLELPSEAEWEYACRAGRDQDDVPDLESRAWFVDNTDDLRPVGAKEPNEFGLYDMLGGVMELCADTWHDSYAGAPTDGSAWIDSTSASRVIRGGSVEHGRDACTSHSRIDFPVEMNGSCVGLRVKCSLELPPGDSSGFGPVVPEGFESLGEKIFLHNGVEYRLDWIQHLPTKVQLPLLPGGIYDPAHLPELWTDVRTLFEEDVRVFAPGETTHPETLNRVLGRSEEIFPALIAFFLTGDRGTRGSALSWYVRLSRKLMDTRYELPETIPGAHIIASALDEEDSWIREMAVLPFGIFFEHSAQFLPRLVPLLNDSRTCESVLSVIEELGRFGTAALPDVLRVALEDETHGERALSTIQGLVEKNRLGDTPPDARRSSMDLLRSLQARGGNAAQIATDALSLLENEPHSS